MVGIELPRLDHINLPSCNYPPSLIDSRGLASKVRFDSGAINAEGVGSISNSSNALTNFMENPLFLALVCGIGILMITAICAAVCVVSRHAASYYTNEGTRRNKIEECTAAVEEGDGHQSEVVGLFPIKTNSDSSNKERRTKVTNKISQQQQCIQLDQQPLNRNNNGSKSTNKLDSSRTMSGQSERLVVSRGVRTTTNTGAYPLCQQEHSRC